MNLNTLAHLLIEVSNFSKTNEKIAQLSGENFNVFTILNLQSSEVRTHSAFLAELLNPRGTHGQKDLFLKLFLHQFQVKGFDSRTAFAEIEVHTGTINTDYTEGGRIDILVTDGNGKHIIIENKIYASDQKNQLIRYYNFDKEAYLFYLNLFGSSPSEYSTDGKLELSQYKVISYSQDIVEWLESCKKEAVSLPIIRETIVQYSNLLRSLTNQTTKDKMKDEIQQLLLKHPDYIDAFEACSQTINSIVQETKPKFVAMFNELFSPTNIPLQNNASIYINWGEDGDGIYFGYQYHESGQNASGSKEGKDYSSILKSIKGPSQFHSNSNYIGWFFAKPIMRRQKFEHLDKKEIIRMSADDSYMKDFIQKLILQENEVRRDFFNQISQSKN